MKEGSAAGESHGWVDGERVDARKQEVEVKTSERVLGTEEEGRRGGGGEDRRAERGGRKRLKEVEKFQRE